MNLGGIVDVAIGMSFIYLLLSLVCSGINELLAWAYGMRAKTLKAGIAALLEDEAVGQLHLRVYAHPLVKGLSTEGAPSYIPSRTFVRALLDTLVDKDPDLRRAKVRRAIEVLTLQDVPADAHTDLAALLAKLPPDGDARVSPAALQDIVASARAVLKAVPAAAEVIGKLEGHDVAPTLRKLLEDRPAVDSVAAIRKVLASLPPRSAVRRQLELFLDAGMNDVDAYRRRLETWFDSSMDRVSGLYKRQAQKISIIVGVAMAVFLGVDSGTVGDALLHDGLLRQATVAAAIESAKNAPPKPGEQPDEAAATQRIAKAFGQVQELNLPIGLPYLWALQPSAAPPATVTAPDRVGFWFLRLVGMLLTGLAISLGAPFWFDVMGKLINLRTSGPPPAKAEKTAKADP
jgi:hypothetical protein